MSLVSVCGRREKASTFSALRRPFARRKLVHSSSGVSAPEGSGRKEVGGKQLLAGASRGEMSARDNRPLDSAAA